MIVLAVGAIGWVWWHSARPVTKGKARLAPTLPPIVKSNGAWIVPVADHDGKPREPMILLPVQRREMPQLPGSTNSPVSQPTNPPASNPPAPSVVATTNSPRLPKPFSPAAISTAAPPKTQGTNASERARQPFDERLLGAQVALARIGISSGSIDGVSGPQTRAAIRAFQQREGLPVSGVLDSGTLARLAPEESPFTNIVVTADDFAGLQPIGTTWLAKSQQTALAHENPLERLAERTHTNPKLLRWLNPQVDWNRLEAGTSVKGLHVPEPPLAGKAAFVRIYLGERKLQAFDLETNLIAHFPCSIAARVDKRPLGEELHVIVVAPNPNYTFDPAVFPESAEARELGRKLILQPGPNNPVGTVWLGLDKSGYGIHGTPKPEDVGRTESHGCFRLANWNAEHLLKLVNVGTPVFVEP